MKPFFLFVLFLSTLFAEPITNSLQLGEKTLTYQVEIGNSKISYIAYTKEGTEPRPITFAFNGGPGCSSVWLHMGCFGPRRVLSPDEGQAASAPYKIVDNLETILDLTDLVFIDPMGTGFSIPNEEDKTDYYSIKGDVVSVGNLIHDYLTSHKRWNSPKYLAGESYGALRACGVADYIQVEYGIYPNGLLLISPAIDYQALIFNEDNWLPHLLYFPTYATTAWYHQKDQTQTIQEIAQKAREFTYNTYAPYLLTRKKSESLYEELAKWMGLSTEFVQRNEGLIYERQFIRELFGDERKNISRYDTRQVGYQSDPTEMVIPIFSGAFHDYLSHELNCANPYTIASMPINGKWNYQDYSYWGHPNLTGALRNCLLRDPTLNVFVGCGYFDLTTPFAATEYCINHLNVPNAKIQMEYYEAGHMYYLNPKDRLKFKADLSKYYYDSNRSDRR